MSKCAVNSCHYFFHRKCKDKESEALPEKVRDQIKTPVFICGAHHCHGCAEPFRVDETVLRCLKCVASYHDSCKDTSKIQQIT